MYKEDIIELIKELDLPYQVYKHELLEGEEYEAIYVYGKRSYMLRTKYPRRYKNLYQPYLRISHYYEGRLYVRDNGYCEFVNPVWLKERLMKMVKE